jgi:hypothetical protein
MVNSVIVNGTQICYGIEESGGVANIRQVLLTLPKYKEPPAVVAVFSNAGNSGGSEMFVVFDVSFDDAREKFTICKISAANTVTENHGLSKFLDTPYMCHFHIIGIPA